MNDEKTDDGRYFLWSGIVGYDVQKQRAIRLAIEKLSQQVKLLQETLDKQKELND